MTAGRASLPAGPDLRGVLAITPQARPWKVRPAAGGPAIAVSRTQLTVLPRKQGTLHGVQGKAAAWLLAAGCCWLLAAGQLLAGCWLLLAAACWLAAGWKRVSRAVALGDCFG